MKTKQQLTLEYLNHKRSSDAFIKHMEDTERFLIYFPIIVISFFILLAVGTVLLKMIN